LAAAGRCQLVGRRGCATDEMSVRFEMVNGLPGLFVVAPNGLVQTTAFELDGDAIITAIYIVRNPDKLRHLSIS
jgi:hypothetical protein